ncbi:MAG: hypothetical protein ACLFRB_10240 [Thiohalorhabdus sp.]|uniref:hypothetical protein n=1 Tax=Thiohalorhabdus sp. TaxID=3094134 RepID=UPI00397EAFAF
MSYRKSIFSYFDPVEVWHFHSDCPDWPAKDYEERFWTPSHGRFCYRCLEKAGLRAGDLEDTPSGYRMVG